MLCLQIGIALGGFIFCGHISRYWGHQPQSVPNDWKMKQKWYQKTPRLRKRAKQIKRFLHPSFSVVQKSLETVPSRGSRCLHDFSVGLSESLMNLRRYTNQKALSRNAAAMAKTKQFTKARRTARSAYNNLEICGQHGMVFGWRDLKPNTVP